MCSNPDDTTIHNVLTFTVPSSTTDSDLASDNDVANTGEDDGSSDDEGMLYLPDLEKVRGN
ncbi:LOW QUALITY PROTEIN: hypothetical protein CsSME_00046269 [Camellia sinensis var. sinensis]